MAQKMPKHPRARCPVCTRIVTITDRGGLRSHGNRHYLSWEQCRAFAVSRATEGWEPDEDGVLRAPDQVEGEAYSLRAVIENWAPEGVARRKIDLLVKLLEDDHERLAAQAAKDRKSARSARTRLRNSKTLDRAAITAVVEPVIRAGAESYTTPEDVTAAVADALMQWLEVERG